jgi:predicted TPR repeat methyltransferase
MQNNLSSGNLTADKRADYARMLGEAGDFQAAAELMQQALELVPNWTAGWFQAGGYFEKAGDRTMAAAAFGTVLALEPDDKYGAGLKRARLRGEHLKTPQPAYVEALFDDYAERFDAALLDRLDYRVPELIAKSLARYAPGRRFVHGIDLGCGTGLMGQALNGKAERMTGIDLSSAMLQKAAAKGLYAELKKADLIDGLRFSDPADLVLAADVFMYLGALEGVTEAVGDRLVPGGLFAFSIELHSGAGDCCLQESLRHAHSRPYVERLVAACGMRTVNTEEAGIRRDGNAMITGLVVLAEKLRADGNADG